MLRTFFARPGWALRIIGLRLRYFLSRNSVIRTATPDGFLIESPHELVSYWSLFVERECWGEDWLRGLMEQPRPMVLDVGANAGLFTHLVWTRNRNTRFLVFEPLPRMARKIRDWKDRTRADLVLHQAAVSDRCGEATFHASEENDPTASLKPEGAKGIQLTVPVVTLDSVVPPEPILLIKIDVEGCECEVLAGAKAVLERTSFVIAEAHTGAALEKIQKELGGAWRNRRVGASDYLFWRG